MSMPKFYKLTNSEGKHIIQYVKHPYLTIPNTIFFKVLRTEDDWFRFNGGMYKVLLENFKADIRDGTVKKITKEEELFLELI